MTPNEVALLIRKALRECNDPAINDVTLDQGDDKKSVQIILTTDDGHQKQVWVIDSNDFTQTDPPEG